MSTPPPDHTDFQPPLPDEPAPDPTPVPRPTAVEDADEDADEPLPSAAKGKGKQVADAGTDEDEWDPAATTSTELADRKVEEKPVAGATTTTGDTGGWQAVWAPAQNAYYFWNATTGAVQWENPLQPPSESQPPLPEETVPGSAASASAATTAWTDAQPDATLPAIDPALAHLLPASQRPSSSTSSDAHLYQTAQFNARTGRFTPRDYQYTVDHLAEANRAKRQEEAYFDVAEWEREREAEFKRKREAGEEGPRKLTKKDMERFRAKKQEKKLRNQAWLRG